MKTVFPTFSQEGLTKLEFFAALAMQGLLASNAIYGGKTDNRKYLICDAIQFAKALIQELENDNK